jgi:hypothetical protein
MVARDGIEPPTRGFSDPSSAFWPPCFQQLTHTGPALSCHKWTGVDTRRQESVTIWSRRRFKACPVACYRTPLNKTHIRMRFQETVPRYANLNYTGWNITEYVIQYTACSI